MAISVTCPGCLKRFQVNDKFAGKSGPCPNCKKVIKVPDKSEEVVVHAPEEFESGGRGASGNLVLKPIAREESEAKPINIAIVVAAVVVIFVVAFVGRSLFSSNMIFSAIGVVLVSPLITFFAYSFLRNDDLEPYRNTELYLRSLACALAYTVLWGVFLYAFGRVRPEDMVTWGVLVTPFLLAGTGAALISLDLEPGNAFCHCAFYLLVTNLLRWAAGMPWIWNSLNNQG